MVVNGKIDIFNHPAYVSKDLGEIYIWKKLYRYGDPTYVETFRDPVRIIQIFMNFCHSPISSPT